MPSRRPDTFLPISSTGAAAHQELTSTGTANVQTFVVPKGACAMLISVATNAAKITFDGTAPSTTNGVLYPVTAEPNLTPTAGLGAPAFVSTVAGNSVVSVLFLG
jgi:hypothetical protein